MLLCHIPPSIRITIHRSLPSAHPPPSPPSHWHSYGILEDMHVIFRINMDTQVEATRQFHSGREMAAWLAGHFESTGQLVY